MKKFNYLAIALTFSVFAFSCKKDNTTTTPTTPVYTVPTTYSFTNVSYTDQLKVIAMADQIGVVVNSANTSPNTVVTAQTLTDMFNNVGGHFNDSALSLNASGLKLSDFCSAAAKADLISYFDSVALYSQSTTTASNGVAGVSASSVSASKKYLLSPNGVFYSQVIKKTLMGGLFAYQVANVYMVDSIKSTVDNSTVNTGTGTALEHNWDKAFGFFGVPTTFPSSVSGLKYLGSYANQVNAGSNCNATIMNAFLKGRAAISAKDLTTANAQATILIGQMDQLIAAAVVQEMKETDANIDAGDVVAAYGTMSEALGFVRSLKYNTSATRVITTAQIAQLEALFDSANPNSPSLYNFVNASVNTNAQIKAKTDAIRQLVGTIYGYSAAELALL